MDTAIRCINVENRIALRMFLNVILYFLMCFRNDENTSRAFCKLSKKCQFSTAWVPLTILLGGNKIYSARPAAFYRNLRYLVVYAIHSTIYYGFYMLIATVNRSTLQMICLIEWLRSANMINSFLRFMYFKYCWNEITTW